MLLADFVTVNKLLLFCCCQLDATVPTNQHQWYHKYSDAMQWQQDYNAYCYCSKVCECQKSKGKLTSNVSHQAIQSNGKGLIVVALVATAYCCIFAIPS